MVSEARKEQFRKAWEKQKEKREKAGIKRKMVFVKDDEKIIIVKESDPNQSNLVEDNRISEMRKRIDNFREKNKGTIALAKQKDLVQLIQQLEEILE